MTPRALPAVCGICTSIAALALGTGCAGSRGHRTAPDGPRFAPYSTILEAAEISTTSATTLLDAIGLLRPRFLATSGIHARYAEVFVDGLRFGTAPDLRLLPTTNVERVQYLSATEATLRYGVGNTAGVIAVTTRRGRRP